MGRMLDALRRIEAERATAGSGRAEQDASPSPPGTQAHPVRFANSQASEPNAATGDPKPAASDPRPAAFPVTPDRSGLFRPTEPRQSHAASPVATESPRESVGRQADSSEPSGPLLPASRWWKRPPGSRPSPARDASPADSGHADLGDADSRPKASASEGTADVAPPAAARADGSGDGPRADHDLVSRLLAEFPPGRNAVVLLCDVESIDVTFAVSSLAVALAGQVTGQVLAIDATSRGAGLERLAAPETDPDQNTRPGWLDVLAGRAGWEQAARRTSLSNLMVVPSVEAPPGTETTPLVVPSDHGTAAIRQLRGRYRFALIGVSPGEDPATATLAREADAIYLVIRPGRTGRRAAHRVVASFRQQGGRVAGCIVVIPSH